MDGGCLTYISMMTKAASSQIFLSRNHKEVGHEKRTHESRIEIEKATRVHRFFCNTSQGFSRAEDGRTDGKREEEDQKAGGETEVLLEVLTCQQQRLTCLLENSFAPGYVTDCLL